MTILKKVNKTEQKDLQKAGETKPKRNSPKRPGQQPQTNPGDNAKYIRHSLRLARLDKIDINDAQAVEARMYEYFEICEEEDMKPSVAGLALALDTDRRRLWEIREGKANKNPAVTDTLKKAMKLLDLQMVDYMQNGKINPVSGIFLMKNNFGYADKQEVVVTPNNPMGETQTAEQIAERYRESVVIDTDGEEVD